MTRRHRNVSTSSVQRNNPWLQGRTGRLRWRNVRLGHLLKNVQQISEEGCKKRIAIITLSLSPLKWFLRTRITKSTTGRAIACLFERTPRLVSSHMQEAQLQLACIDRAAAETPATQSPPSNPDGTGHWTQAERHRGC